MPKDHFLEESPSDPIEVKEGYGVYLVRQSSDQRDTTVSIAMVNVGHKTLSQSRSFTIRAQHNVFDTGLRGPLLISAWRDGEGSAMVTVTTKVPEPG